VNPLSPYEERQIRALAGWKAVRPNLFGEVFDRLTTPRAKVVSGAISNNVVRDAIIEAYQISEVYAHKEKVAAAAGVCDIRELFDHDLPYCDLLADQVAKLAGESAMFRTATGTGAGQLNVSLMMSYSLKTIHTVGFCYGYDTTTPHERDFALGVLQVASADTLAAKQQAIATLGKIEDLVLEEAVENLAQDAVLDMVSKTAVSIPAFGLLAGAVHDAVFAEYVGQVAKYSFQERWLRAHFKVGRIEPNARLAPSIWAQTGATVGPPAYWTSFAFSYSVCYPILFLASLVPTENSFGDGLAAGRDAAWRHVSYLSDWMWGRLPVEPQPEFPKPALAAVGPA
jgi:EcsC protein family